ncbi:biopolymer transporter ExbD [Oculatella sp. LEGE 06141]|uniref:ExbD/TolR family protein n=1 Tax=Oculatella sp. LEGE 06141 TaxID=1828648 RepID=UPI001881CC08|nr:biopolymer transporter ExbD [Oculatella sp. LEGE 06141]MBE9179056.1 biopolymer transporter ExbD [Oculatella sp. LEGE 06141]
MQFRNREQAPLPEINLIPMLNVMMGILAFFVMITMNLTTQQGVEVPLPDRAENTSVQPDIYPLIVDLMPQGIMLGEQSIEEAQLLQEIQNYLTSNEAGMVVLQVDPQLPYDRVVQLLGTMKEIGGDRVSLAID